MHQTQPIVGGHGLSRMVVFSRRKLKESPSRDEPNRRGVTLINLTVSYTYTTKRDRYLTLKRRVCFFLSKRNQNMTDFGQVTSSCACVNDNWWSITVWFGHPICISTFVEIRCRAYLWYNYDLCDISHDLYGY